MVFFSLRGKEFQYGTLPCWNLPWLFYLQFSHLHFPSRIEKSAGGGDVEPVLADVNSDVHSGCNHDILSLSSSYKVFVTRMPLQPFRLLLMTKRRFPDSPAICKYLGGNEITAAAWGTMAIAPGHSLRPGFDASASSETAEQEQREVYYKRNRQEGKFSFGVADCRHFAWWIGFRPHRNLIAADMV